MTGPEHFREAERLLASITPKDVLAAPAEVGLGLAKAQVHATLALAAATAYPAIVAYTGDETGQESRGWANATMPGRAVATA